MFTVNGTNMLGGKVFYRIDDLSQERVGLDFLNNPAALVPDKGLALEIVALLNDQRSKKEAKSAAPDDNG